MHLPRPWDPWPESQQLCESQPFRLFCESPLPDSSQRRICESCGLPGGQQHSPPSRRLLSSRSESEYSPPFPPQDQFGDPFLSYDLHQSEYRLSRFGHRHCGSCGRPGG